MDKEYLCKHYYWDDADNEYTIEAVWLHERNYPDAPDFDYLKSIEVYSQDRNAPDIDNLLDENGDIWCKIEQQGLDMTTATEKDYF